MGNSHKLADSVCGVLFSGARKQDRPLSVYRRAIKDDSGSNNTGGLFGILSSLFARANEMELFDRLFINHPCGICNFQKMVKL
jgi:hypothetical protein